MKYLVFPCSTVIKVKTLLELFWLLLSCFLKPEKLWALKCDLFFGTRTAGFPEINFLTGQVFICKFICFPTFNWIGCSASCGTLLFCHLLSEKVGGSTCFCTVLTRS